MNAPRTSLLYINIVFLTQAAVFGVHVRIENFECLEDLVRAIVREFPLVKPNVGKHCIDTVASCHVEANEFSHFLMTLLQCVIEN